MSAKERFKIALKALDNLKKEAKKKGDLYLIKKVKELKNKLFKTRGN